jgi:hypothetical protein
MNRYGINENFKYRDLCFSRHKIAFNPYLCRPLKNIEPQRTICLNFKLKI